MAVYLPTLICVSSQLVNLDLEDCLLQAGCTPGHACNFFAQDWRQLQRLSLSGSRMDARLAAVHLPNLQTLGLEGCTEVTAAAGTAGMPIGPRAFTRGCPSCRMLTLDAGNIFQPSSRLRAHCMCYGFASLQCVRVAVDASALRKQALSSWPAVLPAPYVPTSVASLEVMPNRGSCGTLDLLAVLAMTYVCITMGARPTSLLCMRCTSLKERYADPDSEDGSDWEEEEWDRKRVHNEPSEEEIELFIRPVLVGLRGLTSLDLEKSHCCDEVLKEIVQSMPDLTKLACRVVGNWSVEKGLGLFRKRAILCSGLTELRIIYVMCAQRLKTQRVCFDLKRAHALQKCTVVLQGQPALGDQFSISLECSEAVPLQPLAACCMVSGAPQWQLGCEAGPAGGQQPRSSQHVDCLKRTDIAFQWARGECGEGKLAACWQITSVGSVNDQPLRDKVRHALACISAWPSLHARKRSGYSVRASNQSSQWLQARCWPLCTGGGPRRPAGSCHAGHEEQRARPLHAEARAGHARLPAAGCAAPAARTGAEGVLLVQCMAPVRYSC